MCRLKMHKKTIMHLSALFFFITSPLMAQTTNAWPNRPIRMVVPALTGGPDTLMRVINPYLSNALGQAVIVDNKSGASGIIGTDAVAKSTPDGYTFLVDSSGFLVKTAVIKKLPYNTEKDFIPIMNIASNMGLMLIVHPSNPAKNLDEFIANGKKPDANYSYSSPGVGNTLHLLGELFITQSGVKMTHVPYKGGAPAAGAVVANEVTTMLAPLQTTVGFLQARKVRALAYSLPQRSLAFPDVPTFKEAGLTDFVTEGGWFGIFAPAGTPAPIINRLHAELKKILMMQEVKDKLYDLGFLVVADSQEDFKMYFKSELKRFNDIAKQSNIQAE
ncbi:Bug family tripartite tricarboxylate transporter substrate binding protein [Polynucleobacter rarus]|uniref:Bug family tripartite tricarboxylate transporter substrate binding protein n=1 Tax=Polynucleobacter rarus TaxID=556055 RepID=UPI000D3E9316|nr:tripartite tricarboxylate transporter substrate-binding protein [Polynucleobacter rarus]